MSDDKEVQEIIDHRDDPDEWSDEPTTIEVAKARSSMLSFRIPNDELNLLEQRLTSTGETLSEFVRGAIALRLHGVPIGPAVQITSGASRLTVRSHIVSGARAEAPTYSFVPDFAPSTASIA